VAAVAVAALCFTAAASSSFLHVSRIVPSHCYGAPQRGTSARTTIPRNFAKRRHRRIIRSETGGNDNDDDGEGDRSNKGGVGGESSLASSSPPISSALRRNLVIGGTAALTAGGGLPFVSRLLLNRDNDGGIANAVIPPLFAGLQQQQRDRQSNSLYVVTPGKNLTETYSSSSSSPSAATTTTTSTTMSSDGSSSATAASSLSSYPLSSELCLLKLLPVKNKVWRQLEKNIEGLAVISSGTSTPNPDAWKAASKAVEATIADLDNRRSALEPVFNPDDPAMMQIEKAERGERLVDALRGRLVGLQDSIRAANVTATAIGQRNVLLALSEVGELLVKSFPYEIPTENKFSYLPRLLGRAKVTFSFRRRSSLLGNVTIVADGFAAPVTAGNFVDLSVRNFYTGLPIKFSKRRVGSPDTSSEFEVANVPVFGSYNEGFYDPLTAQLRRIPFELIRVEKTSGVPNLAYAQGLASLTTGQATLEPTANSRPLLSFEIKGLVGMNHPASNVNGGSSEFFCLQESSLPDNKRRLLDGEYAPFGYITDGFDVFQSLRPNDVIDSTYVDEWGQLNLVKLRRSSFSEVLQGTDEPAEEAGDDAGSKNTTSTARSN